MGNVNPSQWVILARIPNEMIFSLRVLLSTRGYATHARPSKLKGTMSLDHFLQRQRTIHFYRKILRGTKAIRDPATKKESRGFARAEFERHRHVTDLVSFALAMRARRLRKLTSCPKPVTYTISPLHWKDRVGEHGEVHSKYVKYSFVQLSRPAPVSSSPTVLAGRLRARSAPHRLVALESTVFLVVVQLSASSVV